MSNPGTAVLRANTILYCERWQETVAFYRDAVGLAVAHQNDWFVEFALGPPAAFLSVADVGRATIASANGAGITLSWQVADIRAERDRLIARGVDAGPVRAHAWGALVCYFRDPEGHRIELWMPEPAA